MAAGLDVDEGCRFAYEFNNRAPFVRSDACTLDAKELQSLFYPDEPRILIGCAPCQPFSAYNQKNDDPKWRLVARFAELICETLPDIVSMENVPRLVDFQGGATLNAFIRDLQAAGYHVSSGVAFLPGYGVPQRRSRLVLLASRHGVLELESPDHAAEDYPTVADAIGSLPALEAGQEHVADPLHRASKMSETNLTRIRASRPGSSWREWDKSLIAKCHQLPTGRGYVSVYGRMRADEPSPTITTQFFGFGNGRFGHPTQDRGISLREGALLQSFPRDYAFIAPGEAVQFKKIGRMIGNAVPVKLSQAIARSIKRHIQEHKL